MPHVGGYAVLAEIGRGGMGVVHRGQAPDGRAVALKRVRADASARARERFARERRLLAVLGEAEGFVPLLDAGDDGREAWVVMPLLSGGTLRERLQKGALPVDDAIALGRALARALAHAHARGIVHRDLKPENILYASRDRAAPPLVADLGLAKHFADSKPGASQSVTLSRTGELMGTVGYMAPEQIRDASAVGPPADVFALGAILHEALSGWPAFEGQSAFEVLEKVLRESATPIANLRPEVPPWLAAVVARALARDPGLRYPDAAALLHALESGEVGAPPAVSGSRGRSRTAVAGGALAATLGLAAAPWLLLAPGKGPAPRPSPAQGGAARTPAADPVAAACARLAEPGPVTSAEVPLALLLRPEARPRLVGLAARRGVVYAVEDARRLEEGQARTPETATLVGLALVAGGRPADRAAGLSLLRTAGGPPSAANVVVLARHADEIAPPATPAASLDDAANADDAALGASVRVRARAMTESLHMLATSPPSLLDGAVVPATRFLAQEAASTVVHRAPPRGRLLALGLTAEVPRDRLPPRLALALRAYLALRTTGDLAETHSEQLAALARELEAAAREVAGEDPELGAAFLAAAIRTLGLDAAVTGVAGDAGRLEDAARQALDLERRIADGTDTRALAAEAAGGALWLAVVAGTPRRDEDLRTGTRAMRDAARIRGDSEGDHSRLAQLLLENGDPADAPELLALDEKIRNESPLHVEIVRVVRGPAAALELDLPRVRVEGESFWHASRALALADLGRLDEARAELRALEEVGARDAPLPRLGSAAVSARLDAAARARGR